MVDIVSSSIQKILQSFHLQDQFRPQPTSWLAGERQIKTALWKSMENMLVVKNLYIRNSNGLSKVSIEENNILSLSHLKKNNVLIY